MVLVNRDRRPLNDSDPGIPYRRRCHTTDGEPKND
jgi:hypothetical protein